MRPLMTFGALMFFNAAVQAWTQAGSDVAHEPSASAPAASGVAGESFSPAYAGLIVRAIRPHITLEAVLPADTGVAEVGIDIASDGGITNVSLVKTSGSKVWDDAVQRAVIRTARLPPDVDGRVPRHIALRFSPH